MYNAMPVLNANLVDVIYGGVPPRNVHPPTVGETTNLVLTAVTARLASATKCQRMEKTKNVDQTTVGPPAKSANTTPDVTTACRMLTAIL